MAQESGITLGIVLDHMRNMQRVLTEQLRTLSKKVDRIDIKVQDLLDHKRWLDSHNLPVRVSQLEDKVFAGIDP